MFANVGRWQSRRIKLWDEKLLCWVCCCLKWPPLIMKDLKGKVVCTSYNHWNSCRIIICICLMAIFHAREKKKAFDKDVDLLDSAPLWHLALILWQASHRDRKVQVSPQASLAQGRFEILHSKAIFVLEKIMASEFYPTQRLFLSYYSLGLCFFTWFLQWALGQGKEEKCSHWFLTTSLSWWDMRPQGEWVRGTKVYSASSCPCLYFVFWVLWGVSRVSKSCAWLLGVDQATRHILPGWLIPWTQKWNSFFLFS